jgi:hypothetical protein
LLGQHDLRATLRRHTCGTNAATATTDHEKVAIKFRHHAFPSTGLPHFDLFRRFGPLAAIGPIVAPGWIFAAAR